MQTHTKPNTGFELIGHGLLLFIRWPFTSLWKERELDYGGPYPVPKSEIWYRLLCTFGALAEVVLLGMVLTRVFGIDPVASMWSIWTAASFFLVLTGVRVYIYNRNELGWLNW